MTVEYGDRVVGTRSMGRLSVVSTACIACAFLAGCAPNAQQPDEAPEVSASGEWVSLFNGNDIDDWVAKIRGYDAGDNFANTFRVEDGLLKVRYDGYDNTLNDRFGHLYYQSPFSHYHLIIEYRFVGDYLPDTPDWARRNSGVMFHAQDPMTVTRDQDFPICVEMQFLGGLGDGQPRSTANMCSPGSNIVLDGELDTRHCINSTSETYEGDQWVQIELIVYGDSLVTHIVEGDTVMQYSGTVMGGGPVAEFDPAVWSPGTPMQSGYLAVQSEGHPLDFRRIELRELR